MSRVISGLVAILFWSSVAAAQAPPIPPPPGFLPAPPRDTTKTGTAVIRGHVFDAGSGRPLRKAQVRVFAPELRENRLATTDANGAYEIKDLVAGRYQLNASKGSFVQLQYGQSRPFEPGKPLEIANGQTIEKVDFSLPRGGIITGRILDEFGEPASDVQVMADALPVHPGATPADAGWPPGHDQRHRRVPGVRAASGAILRIGHDSEASISTRLPTIDPATRRRTTRTARASPTPSASRSASARP